MYKQCINESCHAKNCLKTLVMQGLVTRPILFQYDTNSFDSFKNYNVKFV